MERIIGRFTFTDGPQPRMRICDGDPVGSHARTERELYPDADSGNPDAGKPVEDAEEPTTIEGIAALCQNLTKAQRATLATILLDDAPAELTPMDEFKRASDCRHGIKDSSLAGNVATAKLTAMSPIKRFIASSNLRHGIGG